MTINQLTQKIRSGLSAAFQPGEAEWCARLIMEDLTGKSRVDLLIDGDRDVSDRQVRVADSYVGRLLAGEPLQYILGYETFMGMRFDVSPAVLIPRPETQELVELISDCEGEVPDLSVLDAGTGSGCIAVSLSRYLKFSHVTAVDISDSALDVARANAVRLRSNVTFLHADMTALPAALAGAPFDIIVSNPPYVLESEKTGMEDNVLSHEPSTALFVSDGDPLRLYLALTDYASRGGLKRGGRIYFEVNPLTLDRLADTMRKTGWDDVDIERDSSGRRRFLKAKLC